MILFRHFGRGVLVGSVVGNVFVPAPGNELLIAFRSLPLFSKINYRYFNLVKGYIVLKCCFKLVVFFFFLFTLVFFVCFC